MTSEHEYLRLVQIGRLDVARHALADAADALYYINHPHAAELARARASVWRIWEDMLKDVTEVPK